MGLIGNYFADNLCIMCQDGVTDSEKNFHYYTFKKNFRNVVSGVILVGKSVYACFKGVYILKGITTYEKL